MDSLFKWGLIFSLIPGVLIVWLVSSLFPTYLGIAIGIVLAAVILVVLILPTWGFTLVGAIFFVILSLPVIFDYSGSTANAVVNLFANSFNIAIEQPIE